MPNASIMPQCPWPILDAGMPYPLGVHAVTGGANIAIPAAADGMLLECYSEEGKEVTGRYALTQQQDGVFFGFLPHAGVGLCYGLRTLHNDSAMGYRCSTKLLLDPWARGIVGAVRQHPALYASTDTDSAPYMPKAYLLDLPARYTATTARPWRQADHKVIIGEAHVRGLTRLHPEIPEEIRGTYRAIAHPAIIRHLQHIGVTTLCLLPIAAWADEPHLVTRGLTNYWGYNPLAALAPEPRLASHLHPATVAAECQLMIDALHTAGIEVVLDVVFNHTAEGGDTGMTLAQRGLDSQTWYLSGAEGRMTDWSGCGNTINAAHPRVTRWILDALRHWAGVYGVDGFRFDLASTMTRTPGGTIENSPWLVALLQDPLLAACRLIAEPWDMGPGGYCLGRFPGRFGEWNDRYRDTLRRYWMQYGIQRGEWAQRFTGSADIFRRASRPERSVFASINYLAAHDGFTLADMLRYHRKHNQANGEDNRDGRDHEPATDCGASVNAPAAAVALRRQRLARALLASLLLSRGTPMLRLGDESGQSQQGNNNVYCQDNALAWLDWAHADSRLTAFVAQLTALRGSLPEFFANTWFDHSQLFWHRPEGAAMEPHDWEQSRPGGLAALFCGHSSQLWLGFQPDDYAAHFTLPPGTWQIKLDSSEEHPIDAHCTGQISLAAHSLLVLTLLSR